MKINEEQVKQEKRPAKEQQHRGHSNSDGQECENNKKKGEIEKSLKIQEIIDLYRRIKNERRGYQQNFQHTARIRTETRYYEENVSSIHTHNLRRFTTTQPTLTQRKQNENMWWKEKGGMCTQRTNYELRELHNEYSKMMVVMLKY